MEHSFELTYILRAGFEGNQQMVLRGEAISCFREAIHQASIASEMKLISLL
jgi:hypothetical protein